VLSSEKILGFRDGGKKREEQHREGEFTNSTSRSMTYYSAEKDNEMLPLKTGEKKKFPYSSKGNRG